MFSAARGKSPQRITHAADPELPALPSGNENLQFQGGSSDSATDSIRGGRRGPGKIEIPAISQSHTEFFPHHRCDQQMQQCHSWSFPSGWA
jgi:hypothetical protein